MRKFVTVSVVVIGCILAMPPACAQARTAGEQLQGDRIYLLQQFLATFYPGLKYTDAELRARWRNDNQAVGFDLIMRNCFHGPAPAPSIPPPPLPPLPYCDGPRRQTEKVLNAWFGTDGIHIAGFHPRGGMLTERLDAVIGEINRRINKGAREYPEGLNLEQEQEAIKILNAAEPAYGPNKRAEFLKFVPVVSFYHFTGCRLDPATAEFRVQSGDILILQWFVSGRREERRESCTASFEPFAGYVTMF